MREVVVTGKNGETEETAQGLVGQVRIRWGPEDLPKAKSLDLICAQKDYSGCRARTDQRGQGWGQRDQPENSFICVSVRVFVFVFHKYSPARPRTTLMKTKQ